MSDITSLHELGFRASCVRRFLAEAPEDSAPAVPLFTAPAARHKLAQRVCAATLLTDANGMEKIIPKPAR